MTKQKEAELISLTELVTDTINNGGAPTWAETDRIAALRKELGKRWRPATKTWEPVLTEKSLDLFLELAHDAGNWSGNPLWQGSKAQEGNLTQLKQAGLLTTEEDEEGVNGGSYHPVWCYFTEAGKKLAAEHGIDLRRFDPPSVSA